MALKWVGTFVSSPIPSYFSNELLTIEQEVKFYREYAGLEILSSFFLEENVFKSYEFFRILKGSRLENFTYEAPMEIYPTLVRMFYANIRYAHGFITYKVKND